MRSKWKILDSVWLHDADKGLLEEREGREGWPMAELDYVEMKGLVGKVSAWLKYTWQSTDRPKRTKLLHSVVLTVQNWTENTLYSRLINAMLTVSWTCASGSAPASPWPGSGRAIVHQRGRALHTSAASEPASPIPPLRLTLLVFHLTPKKTYNVIYATKL